MPFPPRIEQLDYNWSQGRAGHAIVAIVAHATVGTDSRAYLSRGGSKADGSDRKVSIHALIQKPGDPIYRYVPDSIGANHAGFGTMPAGFPQVNPNVCTLGFELENLQDGKDPYTDQQLLAMGWLINEWRRLHGALPILRHADIDPKRRSDPVGLSVAQIESWVTKAKNLLAAPAPLPMPDPLKAEQVPGPGGVKFFCSEATAAFYALHKGASFLGLALADEQRATGQDGRLCSYLLCERAVIKTALPEGTHLALLSEAKALRWV
jgi:hypothetical protein